MTPIRIFVGTTEDQMLSTKVLEYSVRRHTDRPVELVPLHRAGISYPIPKDKRNRPRTPFSFQRFLIPQLCGYQGRGIYVDSDMQVFSDIGKVFDLPIDAHDIFTVKPEPGSGRRRQFSVMLINCDRMKWEIGDLVAKLDRGELNYETLVYEMAIAGKVEDEIPETWNHLEKFELGKTDLIHYTDMPTQPWVSTENPHNARWMASLFEAIDAGFISRDLVRDHIAKSWVRPSLDYQIEHRVLDSRALPAEALALDASFVAPYQRMQKGAKKAGSKPRPSSWLVRQIKKAVRGFSEVGRRPV